MPRLRRAEKSDEQVWRLEMSPEPGAPTLGLQPPPTVSKINLSMIVLFQGRSYQPLKLIRAVQGEPHRQAEYCDNLSLKSTKIQSLANATEVDWRQNAAVLVLTRVGLSLTHPTS